jgi:amino acid transporter
MARGVLLSLLIQGLFCYMFEYFGANYFLSRAYSLADAKGSAAFIGDDGDNRKRAVGGHGQAFMVMEAFTVFLALIGTTLACMNTGARVTYAMGRDKEGPSTSVSCMKISHHIGPSGRWRLGSRR